MYPELFALGPLHFHSWGLMLVLGFFAGFKVTKWAIKGYGLNVDWLIPLLAIVFASAMIGSHLLEIVVNPRLIANDPKQLFNIPNGLTEMGGMLFGLTGLLIYLRWRKARSLAYLDAFALATPLGLGFGRIGCFLAGCCYGSPTNLPWAVVYTNPASLATPILGIPVHPAPIYMLMAMWSLFVMLLVVKYYAKGEGRVVIGFWVGYPVIRFFQEYVRSDPDRGSWFGGALTSYQLLCLLILGITVPLSVYLMTRRSAEPELA